MFEIGGLFGGMRMTSARSWVARTKKLFAADGPVIDAQLKEVLVGRLCVGKQVLGSAAAERPTVGARKQRLEIGGNRRMQRDRDGPPECRAAHHRPERR